MPKIAKDYGPTNVNSVNPETGEITQEPSNLENERLVRANTELVREHDEQVIQREEELAEKETQAASPVKEPEEKPAVTSTNRTSSSNSREK